MSAQSKLYVSYILFYNCFLNLILCITFYTFGVLLICFLCRNSLNVAEKPVLECLMAELIDSLPHIV